MKVWLGLGSNLQQPVAQIETALKELAAIESIHLLKVSSFYRTPPWGDKHQDDFINAVAWIETDLDPVALLASLQSIENRMGRQRSSGRRWGPRLIDIDMLLYGDQQYHLDELEVPHPRMHERAFVLIPLSELDATLEIPGRGAIGKLIQQLDCTGINRIDDDSRY